MVRPCLDCDTDLDELEPSAEKAARRCGRPRGTSRTYGRLGKFPIDPIEVSRLVKAVDWARFEAQAPSIAAVAERLWPGAVALSRGESPRDGVPSFVVAYLATVRADGAPRLHPFCPILAGDGIFAAIPARSPKGRDLRRDPRCVIHAMPGPEDDELSVRAQAREVLEHPARDLVLSVVRRSGVGGMVESVSRDPIFEFAVERVDIARWVRIGLPGTYAERQRWEPQ